MKYFYEVSLCQNITKAAKKMNISQPSMSIAMQSLENEIGLNLFRRIGRKIVLTKDGAILLTKVTPLLAQLQQFDDELRDMSATRNHIRIALPTQIGTKILPMILKDFKQQHPEIVVEVIELGGIEAIRMLKDEALDLAITNYEENDKDESLFYKKIADCECCFCTYKEHPLAKNKEISLADIQDETLVMFGNNNSFSLYRLIDQLFRDNHLAPRIIHYTPHLYTIRNLVKQQVASTFLTRQAVMENDDIIAISLKEPIYMSSGIVMKKSRQIYSDEKNLVEFIIKNIKNC